MTQHGTIMRAGDGGYVLYYERSFARSNADIWAALTDPAILSRWLSSPVDVDLRTGGRFVIHFFDGKETMHGVIRVLEPVHVLEYSWDEDGAPESVVRWTIMPTISGCRLTLTHTLPAGADATLAAELGGGWHALLGHLEDALRGGRGGHDPERLRVLEAQYAVLAREAREQRP